MSFTTKPPPKNWPRISSSVAVANASAAIAWYCKVFGFEVRLKVEGEGGRIEHAEIALGGGLVMLGDNPPERNRPWRRPPKAVDGANTQTMMVFVDDVDAHCAHARAHGATIVMEPETHDYGDDYWTDRTYEAVDPDGHHWWFTQRLK
jgi:uncharacterized glyoxalase superfamily protein PhnB